jgi:hypothetical protein
MKLGTWLRMTIPTVALLCAAATACDEGDDGGDASSDADVDEGAPDAAGDVEDDGEDVTADVVEDAGGDPVEEPGRDCTGMYPGPPFGYKGCIYRATPSDTGTWDGGGDTVENICLWNLESEYGCLAPYYCSSEVDVLFLSFTAMWCPMCNAAAAEEDELVAWMEEQGWTVEFVTMIEENQSAERPSLEDAEYWQSYHDIEGPVLWDGSGMYDDQPFYDTRPEEDPRGWPTFLIVNPDNMLIWDAFSGWYGGTVTQEMFFSHLLEILEIGAAHDPGYIP